MKLLTLNQLWCPIIGAGLLGFVAPDVFGETITGNVADCDIRADGRITNLTSTAILSGGAGSPAVDRSGVLVFKLPNLGLNYAPFKTAAFRVNFTQFTGTPVANVDLYGLGRRSASTVLASDYYGETSTMDSSDAVLLQNNFLTPASSPSLTLTSAGGNTQLVDYLNAAYDLGNGIGDYVFLRLSTDAPTGGVKRYSFTSAESGTTTTAPQIIFNEPLAPTGRPFIWVRDSEKDEILAKIENHAWAKSLFDSLVTDAAEKGLDRYEEDRDSFLRELPINWVSDPPLFYYDTEEDVRSKLGGKLNLGLDCALLYYLTGDAKYARCAGDILHNSVKTLAATPVVNSHQYSGWLFDKDMLMEARVTAQQMPVIYDFLESYLRSNDVYDVAAEGATGFAFTQSQFVFQKYTEICRDRGQTGNNWSSLMAHSLVQNALGLDDPDARDAALKIYLEDGGPKQDSLDVEYESFPQPGSIQLESLQYSRAVVAINSSLMGMLDRYDPSLELFETYPNLPLSVSRPSQLIYPTKDEAIVFGDGTRPASEPYARYEEVYKVAQDQGLSNLTSHYGGLINAGIADGKYDRSVLSAHSSLGPKTRALQLLWNAATIPEPALPLELPRTDSLPDFGIALQRNLSSTGDPVNDLMGFVGGAAHVHSHASGMNIELYGLGEVLGVKAAGKSAYARTFAGANTVIVNGYSRGDGGWKDLAMNTVQLEAMEPAPFEVGVSSNCSFSTSSFVDDKGNGAEATQQRTLAIIRTSPTSGYYVDFFRSDSSIENEYHDYLYQNIGDSLMLESEGAPLVLASEPNRFQNDIEDAKGSPGWGVFTGTMASGAVGGSVRARFTTTPGGVSSPLHMDLHLPGDSGREYTTTLAPPNTQAPSPYHGRDTPTLVVRKTGEAWNAPFAVVFEPHLGAATDGTVKQVTKLEQGGVVVGLKIESVVAGNSMVQYVISNPSSGQTYSDSSVGLEFTGRFAVVTDHRDGSGELYIGEGSSLRFGDLLVESESGGDTEASVLFEADQQTVLTSNDPVEVSSTSPMTFYLQATKSDGLAGRPNILEDDQTIWFDAPIGGASMADLDARFFGNRFDSNGFAYGTWSGTSSTSSSRIFDGTLVKREGAISLASQHWVVAGLEVTADSVDGNKGVLVRRSGGVMTVGHLDLEGLLLIRANTTERDLALDVANLTGSGVLSFARDSDEEDSDWFLDIDNDAFTGVIELRYGNLQIDDVLALPGATLQMLATDSVEDVVNGNGNSLVLSHDMTIGAMRFGESSLSPGIYTAEQLESFFVNAGESGTTGRFTGAATLIIPAPSSANDLDHAVTVGGFKSHLFYDFTTTMVTVSGSFPGFSGASYTVEWSPDVKTAFIPVPGISWPVLGAGISGTSGEVIPWSMETEARQSFFRLRIEGP